MWNPRTCWGHAVVRWLSAADWGVVTILCPPGIRTSNWPVWFLSCGDETRWNPPWAAQTQHTVYAHVRSHRSKYKKEKRTLLQCYEKPFVEELLWYNFTVSPELFENLSLFSWSYLNFQSFKILSPSRDLEKYLSQVMLMRALTFCFLPLGGIQSTEIWEPVNHAVRIFTRQWT